MPKTQHKPARSFASSASSVEVGRAVLRDLGAELRRQARAARGREDPERTHKLRVSVRRLRTALRLFRPLLDATQVDPLSDDLRWLFRRLGAVREFDVLFAALSESTDPAVARAEQRLRAELTERRARAARAAKRALSSKRYVRLLRLLRSLPRAFVTPTDPPPARKWARKRLEKRLVRVLELRANGAERDEELRHELRKQMKKLRYAVELLGHLFAQKRVKAYLAPMIELQDVLGELNDAVVSRRLLQEAAEQVDANAGQTAADLPARDPLTKRARRKLERRFRAFEAARPFWRK